MMRVIILASILSFSAFSKNPKQLRCITAMDDLSAGNKTYFHKGNNLYIKNHQKFYSKPADRHNAFDILAGKMKLEEGTLKREYLSWAISDRYEMMLIPEVRTVVDPNTNEKYALRWGLSEPKFHEIDFSNYAKMISEIKDEVVSNIVIFDFLSYQYDRRQIDMMWSSDEGLLGLVDNDSSFPGRTPFLNKNETDVIFGELLDRAVDPKLAARILNEDLDSYYEMVYMIMENDSVAKQAVKRLLELQEHIQKGLSLREIFMEGNKVNKLPGYLIKASLVAYATYFVIDHNLSKK